MIRLPVAFLLLILAVVSCGKNTRPQNPANRAAPDVRRSLLGETVTAPATPHADRARLVLMKSALEKEFLLHVSMLTQDDAPMPSGLQSRVVFFRRVDDHVYMIEASRGLLLTKEYARVNAIAQFPILAEDDERLTIDFNAGMRRLFLAGDWHYGPGGTNAELAAQIAFTYLAKVDVVAENTLEIRQQARVEYPKGSLVTSESVQIVYYLVPYLPSPDFRPTEAPPTMDHFGFFKVRSQYNDRGGAVEYAAKRDVNKPITFAISASTPAAYREAVREGVLYWNKAFHREVMRVVDAPADVTSPDPRYNMIQWVDNDRAGFAIADAQMDPRTGEVLHQQIYLTTGRLLAAADVIDGWSKRPQRPGISLAGFSSGRLCDFKIDAGLARELTTHLGSRATEAQVLKVTQDLVRRVVAHEVGHTLGLRHNFAGSLAANYPLESRDQLFETYLQSGATDPNLVISSSIMEYHADLEYPMMGDLMQRRSHVDAHDEAAIQMLYEGRELDEARLPLFCTDDHLGTYADCRQRDAGDSVVRWTQLIAKRGFDEVPDELLNAFIRAKAPYFGTRPYSVTQVNVEPKRSLARVFQSVKPLLDLARRDARLLAVERRHAGSVDATEVRRETAQLVAHDLTRAGSLAAVLPHPAIPALAEHFEALLARPDVIDGTNLRGEPYHFTPDELRHVRDYGRRFFARLAEDLPDVELISLAGGSPTRELDVPSEDDDVEPKTNPYDDTPLATLLAKHLFERITHYVFATTDTPRTYTRETTRRWSSGSDEELASATATFSFPSFAYPYPVRRRAIQLLSFERAESPAWGWLERRQIRATLLAHVAAAVPGLAFDEPQGFVAFPREVQRWLLEMKDLEATVKRSGKSDE